MQNNAEPANKGTRTDLFQNPRIAVCTQHTLPFLSGDLEEFLALAASMGLKVDETNTEDIRSSRTHAGLQEEVQIQAL